MTKDEAIQLSETKFWENISYKDIATFQLFEEKLCMPFDVFHEALEKSLGRPVFTHELGLNLDSIKSEFLGDKEAPSFEDVINLIPQDKRILIFS